MKKNAFISVLIILILLIFNAVNSQVIDKGEQNWVDSVFNSLSPDERIAQLFIVRANNPKEEYFPQVEQLIRSYNIGGVTFFGGTPYRQAKQTNKWQSIAKTPLFISIDGEWGLGMRLDSIRPFPYQMTLGAIQDDSLLYRMGVEVARQCRRMGIHINLAPVVDINSNPANPVIHLRSFGEDKVNVTSKSIQYMRGMQDNGVLAVAKHFPGHGDTESDSHYTLPVINHDYSRLDTLELYPFKALINAGVSGIMTAHLYIPKLEAQANTAATLSRTIITDILKDSLGFEGLIITDGLDMKGVAAYNQPGELEVNALIAGNDILLLSQDVPVAISAINKAIQEGRISRESIENSCKKVLRYKYRAGLNIPRTINVNGITDDLNDPANEALLRTLSKHSITFAINNRDFLPLKRLDTLNIATVSFGSSEITVFQESLGNYADLDHHFLPYGHSLQASEKILQLVASHDLLIISIHNTNTWNASDFGIDQQTRKTINALVNAKPSIVCFFSSPYATKVLEQPDKVAALVMAYQDTEIIEEEAAQAIFGGIPVNGKLSVGIAGNIKAGSGQTTGKTRMSYVIPEEIGIDSKLLKSVDITVRKYIDQRVFPGCQIIAAKDGEIFYSKSFGFHTYDKSRIVRNTDLYDVASITKIVATTPAVMRLYDEKKLDIDQKASTYLPYLRGTNKESMIIREMMAHQVRLKAWIPFYQFTLINDKPDTSLYSNIIDEKHSRRVADKLYIDKDYIYIMYDSIISSELTRKNGYLYSDLGFYLLKDMIENIMNKPLEIYVEENFYKPLGVGTCYLPRERYPLSRIVPTEKDDLFRKQLIHGDVHDQGAAMMGGISGHAGVFSSAKDLAVIMQMYLWGGEYGGSRFIKPETVKEFTRRQFPLNDNRRGIGFDKPAIDGNEGPACEKASDNSFGHSGFTGTYAWADPDNGLIFIFLSNRIHPSSENKKLITLNVRTDIQQMFYDAIEKSRKFAPR